MNFNFQGCQIQYIRVAISQKANKIDLPDIPENLDYVTIENAMILLVLGDFWHLDDFWVKVFRICPWILAVVGFAQSTQSRNVNSFSLGNLDQSIQWRMLAVFTLNLFLVGEVASENLVSFANGLLRKFILPPSWKILIQNINSQLTIWMRIDILLHKISRREGE